MFNSSKHRTLATDKKLYESFVKSLTDNGYEEVSKVEPQTRVVTVSPYGEIRTEFVIDPDWRFYASGSRWFVQREGANK